MRLLPQAADTKFESRNHVNCSGRFPPSSTLCRFQSARIKFGCSSPNARPMTTREVLAARMNQHPSDRRCAFPGSLAMSSPRCVTCKPTPAALMMVCAWPLAIGADPPIPKSSQQPAGSGRGRPATDSIPCRPIPVAGEQDRRAGGRAIRFRDFSPDRCGKRR